MVQLRPLASEELARVEEIDVSETGFTVSIVDDGHLILRHEAWQRARRSAERWQPYVEQWKAMVEQGGAAIGAFAASTLVSIAVVRYRLADDVAQLAALFVDRVYRRQGIATALTHEVIRLARDQGAHTLYVSATPSESAVGFYTRQGFTLVRQVNQQLYEREPEDIHMVRTL